KRDNALYEGHSTGMGLGLSFVTVILEHHRAELEILSEPLRGTTFRVRFPPSGAWARPRPASAPPPGCPAALLAPLAWPRGPAAPAAASPAPAPPGPGSSARRCASRRKGPWTFSVGCRRPTGPLPSTVTGLAGLATPAPVPCNREVGRRRREACGACACSAGR